MYDNVMIGYEAGMNLTTGGYSVIIGTTSAPDYLDDYFPSREPKRCLYCGNLNDWDAPYCNGCMVELLTEDKYEEHSPEMHDKVRCARCGTLNEAGSYKCKMCLASF